LIVLLACLLIYVLNFLHPKHFRIRLRFVARATKNYGCNVVNVESSEILDL